MIKPVITNKGTPREVLLTRYGEILGHLRQAIVEWKSFPPEMRDYYPMGNDVVCNARYEHAQCIKNLEAVEAQLEELVEHIGNAMSFSILI